jgi:hypothetical protein
MGRKTGGTKERYLELGRKVLSLSECNGTLSTSALARHCGVSEPFAAKVLRDRNQYLSPALNDADAGVAFPPAEPTQADAKGGSGDPQAILDLIKKYCEKEIWWCDDIEAASVGLDPGSAIGASAAISKRQALNDVLTIIKAGGKR